MKLINLINNERVTLQTNTGNILVLQPKDENFFEIFDTNRPNLQLLLEWKDFDNEDDVEFFECVGIFHSKAFMAKTNVETFRIYRRAPWPRVS